MLYFLCLGVPGWSKNRFFLAFLQAARSGTISLDFIQLDKKKEKILLKLVYKKTWVQPVRS